MNSPSKPGDRNETPAIEPETESDTEKGTQPSTRREVGGPRGPEPTRYGDWEKGGRCIDF